MVGVLLVCGEVSGAYVIQIDTEGERVITSHQESLRCNSDMLLSIMKVNVLLNSAASASFSGCSHEKRSIAMSISSSVTLVFCRSASRLRVVTIIAEF